MPLYEYEDYVRLLNKKVEADNKAMESTSGSGTKISSGVKTNPYGSLK